MLNWVITMANDTLSRVRRLLGDDTMQRLAEVRVIIFGTGGVGSWCADALVRTGLRHLTIVDSDVVVESNVNRQLMATHHTIGQPKVMALRNHLLSIAPDACIEAVQGRYTADTAEQFRLEEYDYVVDAIDSVPDKVQLILHATRCSTLVSSMGAALKTDPTQVAVAEFWKVQGCPLARALRNHFKKSGTRPAARFSCVYSQQHLANLLPPDPDDAGNGSLVQVTAVFGMTLASLITRDVAQRV